MIRVRYGFLRKDMLHIRCQCHFLIICARAGHKWMLRPFMRLPLGIPKPFFTHPCGCAFLRNASFGFLQSLKKAKRRSLTPDVFLMSGSVESFMISICRPVAVLYSIPRSYRSCLITSPLSPLIQTDCFSICTGQYASLKFRQA